eukprot:CAMPEP_0172360098 /NCGR_PEP_ID=MMETSP1060-20121228/4194_1 /TAXON_ID=37318 /ORGANISM="Pseudo-nitzschia pungens, Strain cf. cingulata" /LENGTH=294 /DNA_ID=CAMNT_0013081989 /DNA_START=64 /DNA_END=945 /DNA_ORIENTATION=+
MIRSRAVNNTNAGSKNIGTRIKRFGNPGTKKSAKKGKPVPFLVIVVFVVLAMIGINMAGLREILQAKPPPPPPKPSPGKSASMVSQQAASPKGVRASKQIEVLDKVRQEFNERYKVEGKLNGKSLLEKGLHSFGSIDNTALRILDASRAKRPFVMAFSGYSITVGRGNYYNQSFPFVAGDILQQPMRQLFDIPVVVRNAAIGGIPSFPYGFCLDHFLGSDPDVISWDYSMNEKAKDASVLEAFLRQATKQLPKRPMVIMMDTNANRMRTLDEYADKGWLKDAIAVANKDILKSM